VYFTEVDVTAVKEPHALPEQPEPETLQVTPEFEESFATVAVSVTDCDRVSPDDDGVTATLIWPAGGAGRAGAGTGAASAVENAAVANKKAARLALIRFGGASRCFIMRTPNPFL